MNIVGLLGKVSSEPKSKTVGNYKVTSFYLSVQGAGNWNKDGSTSNYGYGSFLVEAWGKLADTSDIRISFDCYDKTGYMTPYERSFQWVKSYSSSGEGFGESAFGSAGFGSGCRK
jgi:hypothetical protein